MGVRVVPRRRISSRPAGGALGRCGGCPTRYTATPGQAFIESWFGQLRRCCAWRGEWETIGQARREIGEYIDSGVHVTCVRATAMSDADLETHRERAPAFRAPKVGEWWLPATVLQLHSEPGNSVPGNGILRGETRGAPGEIRTPNLLIRSQMLYPLSYGRMAVRPRRHSIARRRDSRNPFVEVSASQCGSGGCGGLDRGRAGSAGARRTGLRGLGTLFVELQERRDVR